MTNTCELLINTVKAEEPKVLKGLSQNGNVVGTGAEVSPVMGNHTTGGKRESNPFIGRLSGTR